MNFLSRSLDRQSAQLPLPNAKPNGKTGPSVNAGEAVRMMVTPDMAKLWLKSNTHNRPLSDGVVISYACDMIDGRWKYNGDPIRFDTNGTLIDGQHRLGACVEARVPFETAVIFGLSPEVMPTIDIGHVRTAAHAAHLDGIPNAALAAAITRFVLVHDRYGVQRMNNPKCKPTKPQINEWVKKLPGLDVAATLATRDRWRRITSPTLIGFCYYVFARDNQQLAQRFFTELKDAVGLTQTNPVYHLRERLISNGAAKAKLPHLQILAIFFKAWNAYRSGKPMRSLRWRNDGPKPEPFPVIDNAARRPEAN
jgi:hypothetical protein